MAHVRRAVQARTSSSSNPITASITTLAADTVLCVLVKIVGANNRSGGSLTFGSSSLIQAGIAQKAAATPEASAELWYLVNPPHGTFTLTIPNAGVATILYTVEAGQAQAGMASAFDGTSGANNTAINPSPGAIVTTGIGDIVWAITAGGWTTWAPTPQAGTVIANTDDGADGGGEQFLIQAAAGSIDMNWTFGTSDDWGAVAAAFKEVAKTDYNNNYKFVACASAGVISTSGGIK